MQSNLNLVSSAIVNSAPESAPDVAQNRPDMLADALSAAIAGRRQWEGAGGPVAHAMKTTGLHAAGPSLIGCAGWSIARPLADTFAGDGSHLARYAAVLPAVEINSSFYRPHRPQTYARWADSVPPGFRFSVKLPKRITHELGLIDFAEPLASFVEEVGALQDRLGCILVQLPPGLAFDAAVAAEFLSALRQRFGCMLACEARHASWFAPPATDLLMRHAITRVIADPAPGQPGPHVPTGAGVYLRLHGSPRRYYSAYDADMLLQVAQALQCWRMAGRSAWCIFDNTAGGAALPDALNLLQQTPRP